MDTLCFPHSSLLLCPRANPNPSFNLIPSLATPRRQWKIFGLIVSTASTSFRAAPADKSHVNSLERCLSITHDFPVPCFSAELSLTSSDPMNKKKRNTYAEMPTGGDGDDIEKNGHGGGDGVDDDDDDY